MTNNNKNSGDKKNESPKSNDPQKLQTKTDNQEYKKPLDDNKKLEDTIEVKQSTLEALIARVESQDKKIEMLTFTADKSRLSQWESRNKGQLIRSANISLWQGKFVIGWESLKDEVKVVKGVIHEEQTIRVYLYEGESEDMSHLDMDYINFIRNKSTSSGNIIEKTQTNLGETYTLEFKDGKKIKIDTKFIN